MFTAKSNPSPATLPVAPTHAQLHAALKFAQARVNAFIADGALDQVRRGSGLGGRKLRAVSAKAVQS
jgi:hypothetical protein